MAATSQVRWICSNVYIRLALCLTKRSNILQKRASFESSGGRWSGIVETREKAKRKKIVKKEERDDR